MTTIDATNARDHSSIVNAAFNSDRDIEFTDSQEVELSVEMQPISSSSQGTLSNRTELDMLLGQDAVPASNVSNHALCSGSGEQQMISRRMYHDPTIPRNYVLIALVFLTMLYLIGNGIIGLLVATGSVSIDITTWLIVASIVLFVLVIMLEGVTTLIYWYTHRDYTIDHIIQVFMVWAIAFVGTIVPISITVVWNRNYGGTPEFDDLQQFQQIAIASLFYWPPALLIVIFGSSAIVGLFYPERKTQDQLTARPINRSEYMADQLTHK